MSCPHDFSSGAFTTVTTPDPEKCIFCERDALRERADKAEARVEELVAAADRYLRLTGEEPAHVVMSARRARSVLWGLIEDARTGPSVSDTKEKK